MKSNRHGVRRFRSTRSAVSFAASSRSCLVVRCALRHSANRNPSNTRTVVANIMNDSIGLYLNDIGKVPLLTAEAERELSRVIEAGREAADKLANGSRSAALKAQVA